DKLIVYSVHGINTNGEWQDSFDTYLKEKTEVSISHFPYKYQYYPIYSFLIPMLRRNEVRRMINELKYCARKAPNSTVHLVGHSFGTYVICEALKEIPLENSPKIGNLILVNSVLKSGYDFSQIVSKHKIDKILCECAINDRILIMSQVFAMGLGMGGRMGFKGVLYKTIHNRFFKGGHSDLFSATKFSDWFNIIMNKEIVYTDERSKVNIVCAVKQSILIAAPYLLLFLVAVPLLLFLG
ncbi:alpha/beta hydrolase, partial [Vibrio parahaemolyticus]